MKLLSASILFAMSIYFLALPQWIAQVFGVTLCSIGFIIFASITIDDKSKQQSQLITNAEMIDEDYYDYQTEINEESDSFQMTEAGEYPNRNKIKYLLIK